MVAWSDWLAAGALSGTTRPMRRVIANGCTGLRILCVRLSGCHGPSQAPSAQRTRRPPMRALSLQNLLRIDDAQALHAAQ
ncbi:hypothetical protein [Lysobacter gummosus]|uniref:hypothetical protein n=1 Tax=Lysobacter gummosus TaxID=262324 RepID=UPI00363DD9AA